MTASTIAPVTFLRAKRMAAQRGWAACGVAFGSVVILGIADGGYYDKAWKPAGLALGAAAGLGALTVHRRFGRLEATAIAALGLLAALMLMSSLWGMPGAEASQEAQRCLVYVAGLTALLAVARPPEAGSLLAGVLAAAVLLAALGVGELVVRPPAQDPYEGDLLTGTVGYANAFGVVMALGVVLGVGLAFRAASRAAKALLLASAALSGLALLLTASRGGILAAVSGLVVLVALRRGVPGGRRARMAAAACAAMSAVALALVASSASFGDRPAYWRVAIRDAEEHPLLGSGAGTFDDYWLTHRPRPAYVRDAHSLYLETAAELGVLGVLLLGLALGAPLLAVVAASDREPLAAAAAGYVAFLVHAGLDWDWEMPVTMLAGLACGASLLVASRRSQPRELRAASGSWATT